LSCVEGGGNGYIKHKHKGNEELRCKTKTTHSEETIKAGARALKEMIIGETTKMAIDLTNGSNM
jgi:hypothetical protein